MYRGVVMATAVLCDVFIPSGNPHVLANSQAIDNTEKLCRVEKSQVDVVMSVRSFKNIREYKNLTESKTASCDDGLFSVKNKMDLRR